MNPKTVTIEGREFLVLEATVDSGTDPCSVCHFTDSQATECPRLPPCKDYSSGQLVCSSEDTFGNHGVSFLVHNTPEGIAEYVARRLE